MLNKVPIVRWSQDIVCCILSLRWVCKALHRYVKGTVRALVDAKQHGGRHGSALSHRAARCIGTAHHPQQHGKRLCALLVEKGAVLPRISIFRFTSASHEGLRC